MPKVTVVPITPSQREPVRALMLEEEEAWMSDLAWDYSSVSQTLVSFLDQDLLPGYIAIDGDRSVSSSYYLSQRGKGIIGSLYTARDDGAPEIAFEVLGRVLGTLR